MILEYLNILAKALSRILIGASLQLIDSSSQARPLKLEMAILLFHKRSIRGALELALHSSHCPQKIVLAISYFLHPLHK